MAKRNIALRATTALTTTLGKKIASEPLRLAGGVIGVVFAFAALGVPAPDITSLLNIDNAKTLGSVFSAQMGYSYELLMAALAGRWILGGTMNSFMESYLKGDSLRQTASRLTGRFAKIFTGVAAGTTALYKLALPLASEFSNHARAVFNPIDIQQKFAVPTAEGYETVYNFETITKAMNEIYLDVGSILWNTPQALERSVTDPAFGATALCIASVFGAVAVANYALFTLPKKAYRYARGKGLSSEPA